MAVVNRYLTGKIYKIFNTIDDKIYVGSSTQSTLAKRMSQHRNVYKRDRCKNIKLYIHMKEIGIDNFKIELIELYPCNSKDELHAREGHWCRTLNAELNMTMPGRTIEQYRIDNRENKKLDNAKRLAIKFQCTCGGKTDSHHLAAHRKSNQHQFYLQSDGIMSIEI